MVWWHLVGLAHTVTRSGARQPSRWPGASSSLSQTLRMNSASMSSASAPTQPMSSSSAASPGFLGVPMADCLWGTRLARRDCFFSFSFFLASFSFWRSRIHWRRLSSVNTSTSR